MRKPRKTLKAWKIHWDRLPDAESNGNPHCLREYCLRLETQERA